MVISQAVLELTRIIAAVLVVSSVVVSVTLETIKRTHEEANSIDLTEIENLVSQATKVHCRINRNGVVAVVDFYRSLTAVVDDSETEL